VSDTFSHATTNMELLTQHTIDEQEAELLPARNCLVTTFARANNSLDCGEIGAIGGFFGGAVGGLAALISTQPEAGFITIPLGSAAGYARGCEIAAHYAVH